MNEEIWLSELYDRNYAMLFRIGRVFLGNNASQEGMIEDEIQETFLRAWRKRNVLQKHPNPDGWLVECFRKCLMNACRKQAVAWKHTAYSLDDDHMPACSDQKQKSPEEYVASKEQIELLMHLLGQKDAYIFLRYCVYGDTAASISKDYQISEQALRMRVSRIKKKILANQELFACVLAICLLSFQ